MIKDGYIFSQFIKSDERIKENIIEVNDTTALNKVRDISVVGMSI